MVTSGLEGQFDARGGLQALLQVPPVREMYGRIGGIQFYQSTIGVLRELIEIAKARELTPIVEDHSRRLAIAQSLLEKELQSTPLPAHPTDAEPRMMHRDSQTSIVVGGGPQEGGYAIELNPKGENRIVLG